MALSEDQIAERARLKRGDINYLTAIVGGLDTQGRDTNFSTLEQVLPNLSFGPVPDVAEVPSASPVRWLDEEGEWPDEPVAAGDEGPGEAASVDAEPAEEPSAAADAPAEDAVAVEPEGDAPEPAEAPAAAVASTEPVIVPDNWETFEIGPLRALATSMGLAVAPTMNKLGLRKLIQGSLDQS